MEVDGLQKLLGSYAYGSVRTWSCTHAMFLFLQVIALLQTNNNLKLPYVDESRAIVKPRTTQHGLNVTTSIATIGYEVRQHENNCGSGIGSSLELQYHNIMMKPRTTDRPHLYTHKFASFHFVKKVSVACM
jgi:hypothetical protein